MRGRGRTERSQGRPAVDTAVGTTRRGFLGAVATGVTATAGMPGTVGARDVAVVSMASNYFDPIGLRIDPGETVRFEIETGSHSATAYGDRIPAGASAFDSGVLSAGSFEQHFEVPGTYDYYCLPHESVGMVGRIVVGGPGGPAEDGQIPRGAVPDGETIVERGAVPATEFEGSNDHPGGRMRGPGMMAGNRPRWMALAPVGLFSVLLSSVAGVAYLAARAGAGSGPDTDAPK